MTRLFGTDGIRGVANLDLRPSLAFALGRATAHLVVHPGGSLIVGCDTRRSGDMFVAAITAGATSMGADVHQVGIVPTPALAFLAGDGDFAAGIMVSASHNPAEDNGLKVLDPSGLKLDDDVEDELEAAVLRAEELPGVAPGSIGRTVDAGELLGRYVAHRRTLAEAVDASGLHVVLDTANGAAFRVAPEILRATGAKVTVIHDAPDGDNINRASGATAPASLADAVRAAGADIGFALDGDADRCVAVDGQGNLVDGDQVLGILALERLARGALDHGSLVVSVLSNGGLQAAVEAAGGRLVRTPVGDKHILAAMLVSGAGLGGEKSGHVIIREHTNSGDGIVTAIELLRVMTAARAGIAELATAVPLLPQQQRAIRVRHRDQWEADDVLGATIADAERRLAPHGRVLVRPSGTEPVLRVMVEGPDASLVSELADAIATLAGDRLH
ncbi:MAG TPA: phosphoglucosamine mutase [Candidatus Limnocylindrales bacterium]|jgi:phosphoglucosamine mutase